jgi:two-component system CheB/CheR fusion protein
MNMVPASEELFQISPAGMAVLDESGRLMALNETARKLLLPDSVKDHKGDLLARLLPGAASDVLTRAVEEWFSGRGSGPLGLNLEFPDKRFVSLMVTGTLLSSGSSLLLTLHNNTRQARTEEKLIKSESLLDTMLQSIIEGIVVVDTEGKITYANPAACQILDMEKDLLGKYYQSHEWRQENERGEPVPPEELPLTIALNQGKTVSNDIHAISTAGKKTKWLSVNAAPLFDENRGLFGAIASFRDITDIKLAEKKLSASETKYSQLFNSIASGVAIYDVVNNGDDFIFSAFNHAGEILDGDKKEELIGKSIFTARPGIESSELINVFKRVYKTGMPEQFPAFLYVDCHLNKWYQNYVYKLPTGEIVAVYDDITKQKQVEEKLADSEFHFRTLADSGQALIWTSGTDRKCNYFNKPWLDFTGRTLEQERGDGWVEGVHPDDLDMCVGIYTDAFDKREPFSMDYRLRRHDGVYRWIQDSGTPRYDSHGNFLGYIGHCLDIDDKKILEQELRVARDKAEESDRLKTAFLNNISHEIRTPLNGILGFSRLLKDTDLTPWERNHYLHIMDASGRQLLAIIRDILEISQIESGQITLHEEPVSVPDLISRLIHEMTMMIPEDKNLLIKTGEQPLDPETQMIADPVKLEQILTNLIANAIKYTPAGVIETGCRIKPDGFICFYVKDTGIGIAPEHHEMIFQRFRQVSGDPTLFQSGSGLGLSIAKAHVELMGGSIGVESEPGKGSLFHFTLPFKKGDSPRPATANRSRPHVPGMGGLKVLVVDDSEIGCLVLTRLLEKTGASVIKAASGRQAIEAFRENRDIGLVLLDIKMPGLDGYETLSRLRDIKPDIRVVAQTAFVSAEDTEKINNSGFNGFLPKPIESSRLFSILQQIDR